nr:TraI domain-containing protein [Zoogloeaceae bacterium]
STPAAPFEAPEATLPVLSATELLQHTDAISAVTRARAVAGLNEGTWNGHLAPVIDRVAELVQLLPASESHHHAHPGGLLIHLCETLEAALRLRRGVILPPGRPADDVSQLKHRWTVALAIAALLHDIGKPVSDVRVRLYGPDHRGARWNAMAGSMCDGGVCAYALDFPPEAERDYGAHQKLGALLLQRLVAPKTLAWLADDETLMRALLTYLSAEHGSANPLADLVKRGESESVRANLMGGPRSRFATARAVPLIERLMNALRRMLAEGGQLPLNRPGAAGYVFEGEIWFAAARLANAVRDYLVAHESAAAIPGVDKNDRLFDVWQDYGACVVNPGTGLALWGGRIEFDDGVGNAGYDLPAMLRFPLALLFDSPAHYPQPMPGRILPLVPGAVTQAAGSGAEADALLHQPAEGRELGQSQARPPSPEPEPAVSAGQDADIPPALMLTKVVTRPAAPAAAPAAPVPSSPAAIPAPPVPPSPDPKPLPAFLADDDSASAVPREAPRQAKKPKGDPGRPIGKREAASEDAALAPVAPALALPAGTAAKSAGGPSSGAVAFMAWVQRGVADGSLPYNTVGAMVHFVKYGTQTGLLLVSPSIFRHYAQAEPEQAKKDSDAPGQATQRALSNSGWHLKASGGKNIFPYQVMRKGDKGGNLLNGFLILEPERFFDPVPPANDRLVLWHTPAPSRKEKENQNGLST